MSAQTQALIISVTWVALLASYILYRRFLIQTFANRFPVIKVDKRPNQDISSGSPLSKAGVLFVFGANIITIMLVFASASSEIIDEYVSRVSIGLPRWMNVVGSILFALYSIWGLLVLVFNPSYTPLYKKPGNQFPLATQGPYRVIRHPRYAAEAALNIALFLFTGIWISLFGIMGWPAIYQQARAEENFLMRVAGSGYAEYYRNTGMFFPKPGLRGTDEQDHL